MNRRGFWGVVLVSGETIAFDIWGLTLQFTAALGFIVPVIALVYLALRKSRFLTASTTAEAS